MNFMTILGIIGLIHLISVPINLYIIAINYKVLYVKDLVFSILFGFLYLLLSLSDMDAILWRKQRDE